MPKGSSAFMMIPTAAAAEFDVLFAIVAEPYDLIVGNAEINALVRSLTASAKLTQPLMRHDDASR